MFRVITVSREYGSGGGEIARRLADRLDWKLLYRCLIEKIASAAQVAPSLAEKYDERTDSWFNELRGFSYGCDDLGRHARRRRGCGGGTESSSWLLFFMKMPEPHSFR